MSESKTPAQCRDEDWSLARKCGLMGATPGTNAWDAALGRFANGVRAAAPSASAQQAGDAWWQEFMRRIDAATEDGPARDTAIEWVAELVAAPAQGTQGEPSASAQQAAPVAWLSADGSDAVTAQKKRDMIAHNGRPGAKLAEQYNVPLTYAAPAPSASPADQGEDAPDMFWNHDDPERCQDSVHNVVIEAYENGSNVGDIVEVQQAIRLHNIKVRIIADPEDSEEISYEPIEDAAMSASKEGA